MLLLLKLLDKFLLCIPLELHLLVVLVGYLDPSLVRLDLLSFLLVH